MFTDDELRRILEEDLTDVDNNSTSGKIMFFFHTNS